MEWLKGIIDGDDGHSEAMHAAFLEGERAAVDFVKVIVDQSKKYADQHQPMAGTLLLFAAVLRATGIIKQGVYNSVKKHGEGSPVKQTWDILEQALTAESIEAAIGEIMRKQGRD